MKPILCLDFDGVCHSYTSGWKGIDVIPDPPVDGLFEFLVLAQEHFSLCVHSSRTADVDGVRAVRDWFDHEFKKWQIEHKRPEAHISLSFPRTKPPAHITIDDRAFLFRGLWPSMTHLLNFKPWNKEQ